MDKSITFLGTSHGNPSMTRFCSSALYEFGGNRFLVDAGEPVAATLLRMGVNAEDVGTVLITHFHGDHANGVIQLSYQMARQAPEGTHPSVYLPEQQDVDALIAWKKATHVYHYEGRVDYRVFPEEGTPIFIRNNEAGPLPLDGAIKVTSRNTRHLWQSNARSQGFLIEADGMRILHTGDLLEDLSDFPLDVEAPPVDLCICEATHFYWNLPEALDLLSKMPLKRIVFNHIGPRWTDGNEELLLQASASLPFPVDVAFDGMRLNLNACE